MNLKTFSLPKHTHTHTIKWDLFLYLKINEIHDIKEQSCNQIDWHREALFTDVITVYVESS